MTLTTGLLLLVTYFLTGFPVATDYEQLLNRGVFPDALHERATAWEAVWGNPYRPLSEIMPEHGHERFGGSVAPRPPSALLVQTPLVLITQEALMPTILVFIFLLLTWIGWLVHTISDVEGWKLLLATPLVLISLPVISTLSYSPFSGIVTVALILTSWRYQDRRWAGLLLGIAVGLKLWPALVVVGFWISGRKRLAISALGTFAVLNVVGLLLPGVELGSSMSSLTGAGEGWLNNNVNFSLALVLWPHGVSPVLATTLAASVGALAALRDPANAVPITIVAGLIASPLSWPTYALVVLPIAALCVRRRSGLAVTAIAIPMALWSLLPSKWVGQAHFLALVGLLVLIVIRPSLISAPNKKLESEPASSILA